MHARTSRSSDVARRRLVSPPGGSQPSSVANTNTRIAARKNDGIAYSASSSSPQHRPRRPPVQDTVQPARSPPRSNHAQQRSPACTSRSCCARSSRSSSPTGRCSRYENPRSPCSRCHHQIPYCVQTGTSSPSALFIAATDEALARIPRIENAGPPGVRCTSANARVTRMNNDSIEAPSRRPSDRISGKPSLRSASDTPAARSHSA